MTARKVYSRVREALIAWGLVAPPTCRLHRRPPGAVRARLMERGNRARQRRLTLPGLLRTQMLDEPERPS